MKIYNLPLNSTALLAGEFVGKTGELGRNNRYNFTLRYDNIRSKNTDKLKNNVAEK